MHVTQKTVESSLAVLQGQCFSCQRLSVLQSVIRDCLTGVGSSRIGVCILTERRKRTSIGFGVELAAVKAFGAQACDDRAVVNNALGRRRTLQAPSRDV